MDLQYFKLEEKAGVAELTFNRPQKANSLVQGSWDELEAIMDGLNSKDSVRVILLNSEGKHFCAGMDLELLMAIKEQNLNDCEGRMRESIRRMIQKLQVQTSVFARCEKPVIAAIQGGCIGAGLDIAASCDFRYAVKSSFFTIKEIQIGMVADLGSLQRLSGIIGEGHLREWAFTGRNVSGEEAHGCGLVNKLFDSHSEMLNYSRAKAAEIAANSPLSVRGTKHVLNYLREKRVQDGLDYVATWNAATILSNDLKKAVGSALRNEKAEFDD